MALARLEIEIDHHMALTVAYENRWGDRQQFTGADAWRMYRLFGGIDGYARYKGTLEEIRHEYILQLEQEGLTHEEVAECLGISPRAHRYWRNGRENDVNIRLAPHAQEEYENKALRETG